MVAMKRRADMIVRIAKPWQATPTRTDCRVHLRFDTSEADYDAKILGQADCAIAPDPNNPLAHVAKGHDFIDRSDACRGFCTGLF
jgi:hypothetical protein